ncbi:MAG: hypothetical protein IZT59_07125 [Verrucomicrobia bacterium]|nr:hypothetical protein [Verrucomicrobiota bacterium]
MKTSHPIILVCALCLPLGAQNQIQQKGPKIVSDEVQKAIDEFNRLKNEGKEKANEVTVVLPPPLPDKSAEESVEPKPEVAPEEEPVLVTGKAPEEAAPDPEETGDTLLLKLPAIDIPGAKPSEPSEPSEPTPLIEAKEPGLEVLVESIRKGTGKLDPEKIKLRASFPAKPLANPPAGWIMEKSKDAPTLLREVEIQPGTVISLDIKPHVLIPNADGASIFAVTEPGFDPLSGYRQEQTVSAILAKSVVQLDEDAKQLGTALSELNRILSSLPNPEPKAVPVKEEVEQ